jgi:hypothetical protein
MPHGAVAKPPTEARVKQRHQEGQHWGGMVAHVRADSGAGNRDRRAETDGLAIFGGQPIAQGRIARSDPRSCIDDQQRLFAMESPHLDVVGLIEAGEGVGGRMIREQLDCFAELGASDLADVLK